MSILTSFWGTNAKFKLYHIGLTIKFCPGLDWGTNDELAIGDLNCGDVNEEYAFWTSPFGLTT